MDWLDKMNGAMEYIETHLTELNDYRKIASAAGCSEFHFLRMFPFITGIPLSEYIRRRRLTIAAFELQNNNSKVIDVAYKYGYESPEAFSRAFKNLHGVMPLTARAKGITLKAYPRMHFSLSIRGDVEMNYRIEKKEAFEMFGVSKDINANNPYVEIPEFWMQCVNDGTIERIHNVAGIDKETCVHAALHNFREGVFSYLICYHTPKSDLPKGYDKISIPELTWAIFSTGECTREDGTEKIQNIWKRIYPEWFPSSGYEHADGSELEMYFTLENGKFNEEVWIPVIKK